MAGYPAVDVSGEPDGRGRNVIVRVDDRATELAVVSALRAADLPVAGDGSSSTSGVVVEAGDLLTSGGCLIMVVDATAAACASALDAVTSGSAMAALTSQELDRLSAIVSVASEGVRCLSDTLVRLSAELPDVGQRGRMILAMAATGASVAQMSSALHVSTATVKRELSDLADAFDVRSRVELLLAARRAGLV